MPIDRSSTRAVDPGALRRAVPWLAGLLLAAGLALFAREARAEQRLRPGPSERGPRLVNYEKGEFKGLTPEGIEAFKRVRDQMRERARLFGGTHLNQRGAFAQMGTLHHAMTVARLAKENMFLVGPSGGAKSGAVDWMLAGEKEGTTFELQLHQMVNEQVLIGGQDYEAYKRGEIEFFTKGSAADFRVLKLDEIDKATPATLATLLQLLNERRVMLGKTVVDADTETAFATSNATLGEMRDMFVADGRPGQAEALFNRFVLKALVPNWLPPKDRAQVLQRAARKRELKARLASDPDQAERREILADELFLKPEPGALDWDTARALSGAIFGMSDELIAAFNGMLDDLRASSNESVRKSEKDYERDPYSEQYVKFPSAEYSMRMVQKVPDLIRQSAFIDFLLSPLADDEMLDATLSRRIELQPLSLWRAHLALTTIGPGTARLTFRSDAEGARLKPVLDFDGRPASEQQAHPLLDPHDARSTREAKMIEDTLDERRQFESILETHFKDINDRLVEWARMTRQLHEKRDPAAQRDSDGDGDRLDELFESAEAFELAVMPPDALPVP